MEKIKKYKSEILIVLGALILLFPLCMSLITNFRQNKEINNYTNVFEEGQNSEYALQWTEAKRYNETLSYRAPKDVFSLESFIEDDEYDALLNVENTGMMAYIEIPDISLKVPVYHETTPDALSKGAAHILGSSLPVGGKNTHALIAGHTGLNGAVIFDNIDQLKEGNRFYVHVLGDTLCYEVDRIVTVNPEDINEVAIIEGEDHITLVTCTPYGINTHRLLVRGKRVPFSEVKYSNIENKTQVSFVRIIISILFILTGITLAIIIYYLRHNRKMKK